MRPNEDFWRKIELIDQISIQTGLETVLGRYDFYEKSLKLTIREIDKCNKNLNIFWENKDMQNFNIEVHGIKGSLANIGAIELSKKAYKLEIASEKGDIEFCKLYFQPFLNELHHLQNALKNSFEDIIQNDGPTIIPPELPLIFKNLENAFKEMNFAIIAEEMEKIENINFEGAIKENIERLKDAVMVMEYDEALELMQSLLNNG